MIKEIFVLVQNLSFFMTWFFVYYTILYKSSSLSNAMQGLSGQ